MRIFPVILVIVLPFVANAQHQGDVWVFANGNGLNFSSHPPSVFSGSSILPSGSEVEGIASIADEDGNLLFYTDGVGLWDGAHNLITDELLGHQSSTNSAYVVPVPQSDTRYYLFTLDAMQNNLTNGLRYSIVDVCGEENAVSVSSMNQLLSTNMTEKMTAIRHANGVDYWLVTHEFNSNAFKVFLITSQGITFDASYLCGALHGPQQSAVVGQMKASPNGEFIALNISNNQKTDVLSFSRISGVLSCLVSFSPDTFNGTIPSGAYGASFSPNSRYLYLSGNGFFSLWQFDLLQLSQGVEEFYESKVTLSDYYPESFSTTFHQLQLGPDGKIYCASWNNEHLAVIHEPDLGGLACAFEDSAIVLENVGNYGLPAFIDSYDYTITGTCDTNVGVEDVEDLAVLKVYPNPATNQLNINLSTNQKATAIGMLDMLGREVLHRPYATQLDVSHLPAGNYVVAVYSEEGVLRKRVVISR